MQVISASLICQAADQFSVFSSISPPGRCIAHAPAVQGDPCNVQRCQRKALLVLSTLVFANSILRSEKCWRFSDGCTADAAGQDDLCTAELALTSYKDRSLPPSSSCSCTTCTRRRSVSYRFVQCALKSLSLQTNHIIVIHFFGFLGKNYGNFF